MTLRTLWRPLAPLLFVLVLAAPARAQYTAAPIPSAFVDISATGTPGPTGDDVSSALIAFPGGFTFSYYETARTQFRINTNGWINFDAAAPTAAQSRGNVAIPSATAPNALLAPFWDDLNVVAATDQTDYQFVAGATADTDRLIIQWTGVQRFGAANDDLNFQIQLYRNGRIEFHYAAMVGEGTSYTVGIENDGGTAGTQVLFNPSPSPELDNTAYRFSLATTPIFATNTRSVNFGAAGACVGFSRSANVVISNQGIGTVTVTGATLTGDPSFSLGTQPTYPVALGSGQSATIPVVFNPTLGTSGPQNATLTVTYNDGTAQTLVIPLSGAADAEGAGFVFRSNDAQAACLNGASAPAGTSFVDIGSHTRVTAYTAGTGDDGYFTLDLAADPAVAGFGPVRLFGRDLSTLYLSTNALVTSDFGVTNFYGGLPASGLISLQAGTMDVSFGAGTTDYDTADPAQYGVGMYYGLSDVDGDMEPDLVITWFHAYDFGSPIYTATTPRYFTSQLIIYKATRENEEDYVEMRFPDGVDTAGVPYRLNTAGTFIEDDVVVGIGEPLGAEAAIFRSNTIGAPLYTGGTASRAIRFEAEIQAIAQGQAGWRMMGAPVRGFDVGRLSRLNLVQSVVGQYPSFPNDNVYTDYNGSMYVAATDVANVLDPGQGFLWYLFNQDLDPGATNPEGTSKSYQLPMQLEGTGAEPAVAGGSVMIPLSTAGNRFNLVANPFRDDMDVAGLASWATGGTLTSAVPQVWDPNVGAFGSYVTVSGSISAWQGFFIQTNTATGLNVPTNVRNTSGTFLGRSGAVATTSPDGVRIGLELTGALADGRSVVDRAATVVFDEDAVLAWDVLDATKLTPLASAYATAAFTGERDGVARLQSQMSLPASDGAARFVLPVVIDAAGTQPELTLSWPALLGVPATWQLELRDLVTGAVVNLREAAGYTFSVTPRAAAADPVAQAVEMGSGAAARFELVVTTGSVVAGSQDMPTVFALERVAPNPTASASTVRFGMPDAGTVTVAVYDLLGRQVATLASGEKTAGWHTAPIDASRLSAGVYVVRMQAGSFQATQRMTVVR